MKTSKSAKKQDFLSEGLELPKVEEKVLEFWNTHRFFEQTLKKRAPKGNYVFYDGPPFATGLPHYGHILASAIKDAVPRYQTMRGRHVPRRWGWDCHGLPIENIVEKKLKISGKRAIEAMGIGKFNAAAREQVLQYVDGWRATVNRIGRWVDFDGSYKTMDATYIESVWWALKEIHKKKLLYEGSRVLPYCTRCETPIAQSEIAMDDSYKDITEKSVYMKFRLKSGQKMGKSVTDNKTYILSWTTTPWTLPGNVALAVGSDITYVLVKDARPEAKEREQYVVAKERLNDVIGVGNYEILHEVHGKQLVGLEYEPLFKIPALRNEKSYRVYAADFVTTTDGTGVVHTAVMYGEEDFELGVRVGLPQHHTVDATGHFLPEVSEELAGMYVKKKEAEQKIFEYLERHGFLFRIEDYRHSYPHCYRCETPILYYALPAWFIKIQDIKKNLLALNKRIHWVPEHLKEGRFQHNVETAPDWNISRNRYWASPLPIWKCETCRAVEVVGGLDELSDRAGGSRNTYWVIRHGEAENNVEQVIDAGEHNFHLTKKGREQVRRSVAKLKKEKIDLIISSDILRTKETAEIAAEVLGIQKITFDKRLEEIRLPGFSGCHDEAYWKAFPAYEDRFEKRPEGGESLRDLRTRMWNFLKDIEERYEGKRILLVSHEDPLWVLFQSALGWSEKTTIAAKADHHDEFIANAEVRPLAVKKIPRDETGEADPHRPYIDEITFPCKKCGHEMRRIPEVFDCWFESGSMPFAAEHYPFEQASWFKKNFPAQFVAEYIAQTRTWFYYMLAVSGMLFKKEPFQHVVTTGTVLAEDGQKMSKSKGNYPDPQLLIDRYGADALRLYLFSSSLMRSEDLNFSEKGVGEIFRKVPMRLSNVYAFYRLYASSVRSKKEAGKRSPSVLDRWIVSRFAELVTEVTAGMEAYEIDRAVRPIADFVDDLSTWYLRRSRTRLKNDDQYAFATMRFVLREFTKIAAPFMPFLAEAVYQPFREAGDPESVHLANWPVAQKKNIDKALHKNMAETRRIASAALAKRAELGIKVRQPLAELRVKAAKLDKLFVEILKDEVNVKNITFDQKLGTDLEFDTRITPELRTEGLLRELVRTVQELRQEAELTPKDQIVLLIDAPNINSLVAENEAFVRKEINAKAVEYKRGKFTAELTTKFENETIWVALRKV